MKGINTHLIKAEEALRAACMVRNGVSYGDKTSKKAQKIHVVVRDPRGSRAIMPVSKRCECGGHTWSAIWGGDAFVCHHCGKQYFPREFDQLPEEGLQRCEVEDRRILAMLLAGGDLREHPEKNVLVLKNYAGIPEGELPLAYAEHIAEIYKCASVVTIYHKPERTTGKQNITFVRAGV